MRAKKLGFVAVLSVLAAGMAYAEGYRSVISDNSRNIAVCVVKGTPYEMGKSLGQLTKEDSQNMVGRIMVAVQSEGDEFSNENLDKAWNATAPYISENIKEELRGLADGSEIPLQTIQRSHMVPLIAEYSCSSIAIWGPVTKNGDLYLTRNLDWEMELLAHDFATVVVYLPKDGIPHVNVGFAGYIGCNTGFNAAGIALAEMGDAGGKDKPYNLDGYHFTMFFRDMLYECKTLDEVLAKLKDTKRIKKYHYVFGSGKEKKGAKAVAHAPNLDIFFDNDPKDEFAPNVMANCVYNDEGRGAFPLIKKDYGKHTDQTVIDIVKAIPIKGANVLGVVYDATTFEMWFSYAKGTTEAYLQPYMHLDVKPLLDYSKPMQPVLAKTDGTKVIAVAAAPAVSAVAQVQSSPGTVPPPTANPHYKPFDKK